MVIWGQIYLHEYKVMQKSYLIPKCDNFGIDFKYLIDVALAILGKIKPARYFQVTKMRFFKGKQLISTFSVSMNRRSGRLTIQKAGNYGGAIHLCISRGSFCWAKWKLSKMVIFWVITAGVIKNIPQISPKNEINLSITFYTLGDCNFAQNFTTIKQEANWIYPIKVVPKIFISYTT